MRTGNRQHRRFIPELIDLVDLVDLVAGGFVDPTPVPSQQEGLTSAILAYQAFDRRAPGWLKVELTA